MFYTIALSETGGAGGSQAKAEYDKLCKMGTTEFYDLRHNAALFADKMKKIYQK